MALKVYAVSGQANVPFVILVERNHPGPNVNKFQTMTVVQTMMYLSNWVMRGYNNYEDCY